MKFFCVVMLCVVCVVVDDDLVLLYLLLFAYGIVYLPIFRRIITWMVLFF